MPRVLIVLLLLTAITFGIWAVPVQGEARPIYVAGNWQDYLRLVPLSVRDEYVPVLYADGGELTTAIEDFATFYAGTPRVLGSEDIDRLAQGRWPQAETIVLAQGRRRLGLFASAIAAALEAPLYFESPPSDVLHRLQVREVIAVGDVTAPDTLDAVRLHDAGEAQAYYDDLIGEARMAVLAANDQMGFLGAEVAAYHRGALLLKSQEIPPRRPRYLAWVTEPEAVTHEAVQNLYELCRFTPGSRVYDVRVGILTGLSAHDIVLLIARTYAYPEFQGAWRTRLVNASADGVAKSQTSKGEPFEVVTLEGKALTRDAFSEAIQSAGHVMIGAHGGPSGFALADGGWPRSDRKIAGLPPLVFVAESCETGDITGFGVENSVALRVVAAGAAAYVGSMEVGGVGLVGEHPFAFSTPRTPLGELVRLQNAARMDVDADVPRAILIGEPTFHQFEHEWIHYDIRTGKKGVHVKVVDEGVPSGGVTALNLHSAPDVAYAEASLDDGRHVRYVPGMWHFGHPLSAAPTFDHQVVLLEWPGGDGELVLSPTRPLGATALRILSDALIGVEAILIDLLARAGVDWFVLAAGLAALLFVWWVHPRLDAERRWTGLLAGEGMGLLAAVYCIALAFSPPWPLIAAIGCGATVVAWIIPSKQKGLRRVALGVSLYLAPFLLVWMVAAGIGVSKNLHVRLGLGLLLVGLAYGLISGVAEWIYGKAAHPTGRRERQ